MTSVSRNVYIDKKMISFISVTIHIIAQLK